MGVSECIVSAPVYACLLVRTAVSARCESSRVAFGPFLYRLERGYKRKQNFNIFVVFPLVEKSHVMCLSHDVRVGTRQNQLLHVIFKLNEIVVEVRI